MAFWLFPSIDLWKSLASLISQNVPTLPQNFFLHGAFQNKLEPISKITQQDDNASKLQHAEKIISMIFPTGNQSSEIMQPGEQALHFPSASIASQYPSILGFRFLAVYFMRSDKLGSIQLAKPVVQWIAVVCFIANYTLGRLADKPALDRALNQLHFVG